MKNLFDEMLKDGLTPRARHFKPFVEMEAIKGDPMDAFRCLDDLRHSGTLHERIVDIYVTVVRACVGRESRQLTNKVLELFYDVRRYRDLLSFEALETIKLWFDSQKDPKWVTAWSFPTATYHCQACKQKLETGHFTAEELQELKDPLISHMLRNRKILSEVRSHTTAGKYVDYNRPGHSNRFPVSVVRFIETTGRYDVVVDGLNAAYYYHHFDAEKLKAVAEHFLKQEKRVLVVGSSPISLGNLKRHDNVLPSVMDFLREHCGVFCLAGRSLDDVYLLSAAMQCGPGTLLVSSDMFSNHLQGMDLLMKAQFTRWQELYQMKLASLGGKQPMFESVRRFDSRVHVQTTGDTWHFPSSDGSKWLCVRREDKSLLDSHTVSYF